MQAKRAHADLPAARFLCAAPRLFGSCVPAHPPLVCARARRQGATRSFAKPTKAYGGKAKPRKKAKKKPAAQRVVIKHAAPAKKAVQRPARPIGSATLEGQKPTAPQQPVAAPPPTVPTVPAVPAPTSAPAAPSAPPEAAPSVAPSSVPTVDSTPWRATARTAQRERSVAMEELRAHAGTQFCPTVVAAMEALYREQPQVLGAAALCAVGDAAA